VRSGIGAVPGLPHSDDYLGDWGGERRCQQCLSVCEQNGLNHDVQPSLTAMRSRLARESGCRAVEKPGAYYQRILPALLDDH